MCSLIANDLSGVGGSEVRFGSVHLRIWYPRPKEKTMEQRSRAAKSRRLEVWLGMEHPNDEGRDDSCSLATYPVKIYYLGRFSSQPAQQLLFRGMAILSVTAQPKDT
jgi:hypothetical protein